MASFAQQSSLVTVPPMQVMKLISPSFHRDIFLCSSHPKHDALIINVNIGKDENNLFC